MIESRMQVHRLAASAWCLSKDRWFDLNALAFQQPYAPEKNYPCELCEQYCMFMTSL
jgi:hypothetical protein